MTESGAYEALQRAGDAMRALWHTVSPSHKEQIEELQWLHDVDDLETYRRVLAGYHGYQAPTEFGLATVDWSATGWDSGAHSRLALLHADMTDLGMTPDAISELPVAPIDPPQNLAEAVGVTFIVEGSRNGSRILAEWIGESLPDAPQRFFGAGHQRADWLAFSAMAEKALHTTEDVTAATSAALASMRAFTDWSRVWRPANLQTPALHQ